MKITETITRECCQFADLQPYLGLIDKQDEPLRKYMQFCKHCGQTRIADTAREPSFEESDLLGIVSFKCRTGSK